MLLKVGEKREKEFHLQLISYKINYNIVKNNFLQYYLKMLLFSRKQNLFSNGLQHVQEAAYCASALSTDTVFCFGILLFLTALHHATRNHGKK